MKKLLAAGLAVAATVGLSVGSASAETVDVSVSAGGLSANTTSLTLSPITYSNEEQGVVGEVLVTADDSTGVNDGWSVTMQASDFTGPQTISASALEIFYVQAPQHVGGPQAINAGGPKIPGIAALGSLNTARTIMQAASGSGQGTYTERVGLQLTVPASAPVGAYSTTLTVSIVAAP